MSSATNSGQYVPTKEDLVNVITLLHDNGIKVSNSKDAYKNLKTYEGNPSFCILLAAVYGADQCPVEGLALDGSWPQYRQLAAIALKNNVSAAKYSLGEIAVKQVAQCALQTLCNAPDARIARASAQIVVKVTELTSFEWWLNSGLGDVADTLLNKLLPSGGIKTLAALYALQYLMEDLPKQVGQASEQIVTRVAQLAVPQQVPLDLRKASFRMCFNIYERSSLLDWNVETLSPLQQGLANASWTFAQTCTSLLELSCWEDVALMTAVLRSCFFLLDYFDYFYMMTPADCQRLNQFWITQTVSVIIRGTGDQRNDELVGAAIDLITAVLQIHDRNSGEGAAAFLAGPVMECIPALVPALVRYSFMSDEEVNNIMESDDYQIRDQSSVRLESKDNARDLSKDDSLDDDEAAMSLRRSALRCVDQLCSFASGTTFNALNQQIQPLWGNADWRAREAGIVLVGTMATGCSLYLGNVLDGIISQLIQFAGNTKEHICVSSIAMWSLSRLLDDMLSARSQSFDSFLSTVITRMPSRSKRIQHTSVSALNEAILSMRNFQCENRVLPHFESLMQSVVNSLPMFSSVSLTVFIDMLSQLLVTLASLGDSTRITQLGAVLKQERAKKFQLFEQSYASTYVNDTPNSFVDIDVFSLDRGLVGILALQPDIKLAGEGLSTWNNVLEDMLRRDLFEETSVILGVVSVCFGYFNCLTTERQQEWNKSSSGALPQNMLQLLSKTKSTRIKVCVSTMLNTLVKQLGSSAVPENVYDGLVGFLANAITEDDDAELKFNYARLCVTMVLENTQRLTSPSTAAALSSINNCIRSDVYGDTLYYYTSISYEVCRLLAVAPSMVGNFNFDVISTLLGKAENDFDKSEATIHWSGALMRASPAMLDNLVSRIIVVAFSWQQVGEQFPGTQEAVRAVLHHVSSQCRSTFETQFQAYPPQGRQMIMSLYFQ